MQVHGWKKKNKIILFVYHQDILLYLSMKSEEQCVSTVRSLAYLLNNVLFSSFLGLEGILVLS